MFAILPHQYTFEVGEAKSEVHIHYTMTTASPTRKNNSRAGGKGGASRRDRTVKRKKREEELQTYNTHLGP